MILRDYQQRAVEESMARIAESPLICQATGSGKTEVAIEIIRRFPGRVLFVAPLRQLVTQAADRFRRSGLDCGIIMAGHPRTDERVQVCSVHTLGRRGVPETDLVIVDEAHLSAARSYEAFRAYPRIGLSATPCRADGRALSNLWGAIIQPAPVDELIRDGWLLMPRFYAPGTPDMRGVATKQGDYETGETSRRMSQLVGNIVEHWLRLANNRTACFAVDIRHSLELRDQFRMAGVAAEHVDADTPDDERKRVFAALAAGDVRVVTNVGILGLGWDCPVLETVILARPTKSLALHLQQVGRVMRPAAGKTALVLDHAGNCLEHGLPNQRIAWTLEGRATKDRGPGMGIKRCLQCYAIVGVSEDACPRCGAEFTSRRVLAHVDGQLVEVLGDEVAAARLEQWRLLMRFESDHGSMPGLAVRAYRRQFGMWPHVENGKLCETEHASDVLKKRIYERLVEYSAGVRPRRGRFVELTTSDRRAWCAGRYEEIFKRYPNREIIGDAWTRELTTA